MAGPADAATAARSTRRRRRLPGAPAALWAIPGFALLLRGAALLATRDHAPFGDAADYDLHATALSLLGTYPPTTFAEPGTATALRPPGHPYWLGAIYDVSGLRFTAGRGAGVALGVLGVALVWGIAARLWDERVARWSAGVAAVVPALVWLPAALLTETLFVPLVLAAVLCLLVHRDRPAWWWAAAAGALVAPAAAGVVLSRRRPVPRTVPRWLVAIPVLLLLAVVPLLGSPRYRVPIDPFLALPAGLAVAAIAGAGRAGPRGG